jgi:hypothetical protein
MIRYKKRLGVTKHIQIRWLWMTCLEMYERLGLLQKNILYFGRTEENNGNEVQNKLRVDNGNMGFPDPLWRCKVSSFFFPWRKSPSCRSQWPRSLKSRRCAAARLLRLWVPIPPWARMSVCCECCVLSGRGLCDKLITRPEGSYQMWCVVCDLDTSWRRRPWTTTGYCTKNKQTAASGPVSPHYRGFTITLRYSKSVGLLWTSNQPWQNTMLQRHRHPYLRRDSNSQSQQDSGRSPRPLASRPLGSAYTVIPPKIILFYFTQSRATSSLLQANAQITTENKNTGLNN